MGDIRQQVLNFAAKNQGKRVWARMHKVRTKNGIVRPLVNTSLVGKFTLGGDVFSCSKKTENWNTDDSSVLTDQHSYNDLEDQDEKLRLGCGIGVGECWDLAYAALQPLNGLKNYHSNRAGTNRVWSNKPLNNLVEVKGGDILEIRPTVYFFKFSFKKEGRKMTAYKSEESHIGPKIPHTAIIKSVNKSKGSVEIYQQNSSQGGIRNLLVHIGNQPLMNKIYPENGYKVLQVCGGTKVKRFYNKYKTIANTTTSENFFNASIQKRWNGLIKQMKSYITTHHKKLPNNVIIYVPQS